jgi:hypothetical protein
MRGSQLVLCQLGGKHARDACTPLVAATSYKLKRIFSYKPLESATVTIVTCAGVLFVVPTIARAHGFAGSRFFPATLVTDDPFVNDELSLPTVSSIVTPDEGGTRDTEVAVDIAKRITANFGIELGETIINLKPPNESAQTGFGNLELAAKYEFFESDEHETILSLGAGVEIDGTGNKRVDANSFTTLAPGFSFGKGFGDLPDTVSFLKPLAVTGLVGVAIPTSSSTRTVTLAETTGEREIVMSQTYFFCFRQCQEKCMTEMIASVRMVSAAANAIQVDQTTIHPRHVRRPRSRGLDRGPD